MYQQIIIVGNLGNDPVMRYTPTGIAVTNFSIAANRTYTDANGERVTEVTWFRVSAWGKLAETVNKYLARGKRAMVVGTLVPDQNTGGPRIYKNQNGEPGAAFEVRADRVVFLSPPSNNDGTEGEFSNAETIPF